MIRLDNMLRATALGTLRGVFAIGAALAYLQAIVAVVAVVGFVVLIVRTIA